jgi:hypothetical protein
VGLALAVAILLVPVILAAPAHALQAEEELTLAFEKIETMTEEVVPPELQPAFLAKLDEAHRLLLPAIQAAREATRHQTCAAVHMLTALGHQAELIVNRVRVSDDKWAAYIQEIDALVALIEKELDPSPPC